MLYCIIVGVVEIDNHGWFDFYNLKATNIYIFFSFNQNQNFIKKNTVYNFQTLAQ